MEPMCTPLQYAELGETVTLECSFEEDSYGIYWYDTTDVTENPFLYLDEGVKTGEGYLSGEFDIHANGSLIIKNVSLDHDRVFTVVQLQNRETFTITNNVKVVVTVQPPVSYPSIQWCHERRYCYNHPQHNFTVTCSVNATRPPLTLAWKLQTVHGKQNISFDAKVVEYQGVFTTLIAVDQSGLDKNTFAPLVCDTEVNQPFSSIKDAVILLEINQPDVILSEAVLLRHSENESVTLPCSDDDLVFFVWKKQISASEYKVLAHGSSGYAMIESSKYTLRNRTSLDIARSSIEYNGIYVCFFGDGVYEGMALYNVSVSESIGTDRNNDKNWTGMILSLGIVVMVVVIAIVVVLIKRDNPSGKQVDGTTINASLVTQGTPAIYELNYSRKPIEYSDLKTRKCDIGTCSETRDNKVVLFVGETGAGKTTVINALVNYLLGVTWHDDFRYQLPLVDKEKNHSQRDSQTKWISVYTFHEHRYEINFDITIIDTPGLGDTNGETRDEEIMTQIRGFFTNEIDHLNMIAFVKKASDLRKTDRETYITSLVKTLFGKDVAKSLCLFATYASVSGNEAFIDIAKHFNFGSRDPFFFNNEHLYLEKSTKNYKALEPQWSMGWNSFISFTKVLSACPNVGLELTREVGTDREQLKKVLSNFPELLKSKVIEYTALQVEENVLLLRSVENEQSVYDYEETYEETVKTNLSDGKMAIVCMQCERTCCNPCYASFVSTCSSIRPLSAFRGCGKCESRCSSLHHFKRNFIYERKVRTRTITNEAFEEKLKSENHNNIAHALKNVKESQENKKAEIFAQVETIRDCIDQIDRLSLASPNTNVKQFLQDMITSETSKAESGWEVRVKFLKELASCEK
ncbi:hypothetical protein BSL78_11780 [Apostichopus japonicus]|uniref:Immunoglobulin domain-containing protein n=1 Tax=Stichopus japonicus TaxID=307972 RepID=A0A2G8KTL1_STIJA|nr:hypothetical protein BSL78_11780 [Apostichopus japonicus]